MADFKDTLAKQQAEQALSAATQLQQMRATQAHQLQATQALQMQATQSHSVQAASGLAPISNPNLRYSLESIRVSNQNLTALNFIYDIYALHDFQKLETSRVQLFSDGVYRVTKEERGVVSHVPAFVRSA